MKNNSSNLEDKIAAIIQEHITITANSSPDLTRYRHISATKKIVELINKEK